MAEPGSRRNQAAVAAASCVRLVRVLLRVVLRTALAVIGGTFLVRAAIEISLPGGFRAVVLPYGINRASERDLAIVERYHLDENLLERHMRWLGDVLGGDLGTSTNFRTGEVGELIIPRLSISFELMFASIVGSALVGIAVGLLAVAWSGRRRGRLLTSLVSVSQSVPVYVLPIGLIWLFAIELRWLPAAGWVRPSDSLLGNLETLALPMLTLVIVEAGPIARIVHGDVSRVMQADYIAAAMTKGLGRWQVLFRHALRPGSLGLLNVVGLNIGSMLGGTILIELIFGIGGVGQLLLRSATDRDLHLLLALTGWFILVYSVLNGIVDVLMRVLDPRISRGASQRV